MIKKVLTAVAAGAAVVVTAAPALAHVTIQPNEALVGSFARFVVRVPTERPDADTTKVQVSFPENLTFVSFQPKEGWTRTVKMKTLDEPIEVFGEEVDEVVGTVTWSGGTIAPGEFDEFGFSARVPEEESTLEFAALQAYSSGEVVRWIGPPDADEPAARVGLVDLEAEEGLGELGVLHEAVHELEEIDGKVDELELTGGTEGEDEDDEDSDAVPMLLGGGGLALGAIALAVALKK